MAAQGQVFEARYKLRFAHCDPAGIAFFPRLVEMINAVVEDWFEGALELDFRKLHGELRLGVPAVALSVEFVGPARLGDVLVYRLSVLEIGRTSVTLDIRAATSAGEPVLNASHKIVLTGFSDEGLRAVPVEGSLRERIEAFRGAGGHG